MAGGVARLIREMRERSSVPGTRPLTKAAAYPDFSVGAMHPSPRPIPYTGPL